ncbi:MAG: acyl-CoA dehydrogenase family protein [Steroidobacteraceae bacterium]
MSAMDQYEELRMFRDTVRRFLEKELVPRKGLLNRSEEDWRAFWRAAGRIGIVGAAIPEEYGGPGLNRLSIVVIAEELGRLCEGAVAGACLTSDMATSVLVDHGSEAQKREWFPKILAGEVVQAMAITEPGAGSDAGAIKTTAVRDGDHYVLNGTKCFISNGSKADLIYLIAKTDPSSRTRGISTFILPGDTPGLTRRPHPTLGYKGGDTGEMFLDSVRIPAANLVGEEGRGFAMFDNTITLDRFHIASRGWQASQKAFEMTLEHARSRRMFGQRLIDLQHTQFKLAQIETDLAVMRAFIDRCITDYIEGRYDPKQGTMLKIAAPEMEGRVMDACVQMWGGYAWMEDHPIAPMFTAARLQRIWAGATELQLSVLGRQYLK